MNNNNKYIDFPIFLNQGSPSISLNDIKKRRFNRYYTNANGVMPNYNKDIKFIGYLFLL